MGLIPFREHLVRAGLKGVPPLVELSTIKLKKKKKRVIVYTTEMAAESGQRFLEDIRNFHKRRNSGQLIFFVLKGVKKQ